MTRGLHLQLIQGIACYFLVSHLCRPPPPAYGGGNSYDDSSLPSYGNRSLFLSSLFIGVDPHHRVFKEVEIHGVAVTVMMKNQLLLLLDLLLHLQFRGNYLCSLYVYLCRPPPPTGGGGGYQANTYRSAPSVPIDRPNPDPKSTFFFYVEI